MTLGRLFGLGGVPLGIGMGAPETALAVAGTSSGHAPDMFRPVGTKILSPFQSFGTKILDMFWTRCVRNPLCLLIKNNRENPLRIRC